jgi:hypothetical protein
MRIATGETPTSSAGELSTARPRVDAAGPATGAAPVSAVTTGEAPAAAPPVSDDDLLELMMMFRLFQRDASSAATPPDPAYAAAVRIIETARAFSGAYATGLSAVVAAAAAANTSHHLDYEA